MSNIAWCHVLSACAVDTPNRFPFLPRHSSSSRLHSSTYLLISSSFFFIFFQDASTQGLKVTAVDHNLDTVFNTAINFDTALPHYKTKGGFHQGENDVVTAVRVTVLMHPLRFFDEIEDTDGVHHAP